MTSLALVAGQNEGAVNAALTMSGFRSTNGVVPTYEPQEVKSGLLATLFPGESTWNRLYNHDYKEIAATIFEMEEAYGLRDNTINTDTDKDAIQSETKNIENIVKESYMVAAYSHVYQCLIIASIFGIISLIYLMASGTVPTWAWALTAIFICLAIPFAIYAYGWSQGVGEAYWKTFRSDLNSLRTGRTNQQVLTEYESRKQKDLDRNAMQAAAAASRQSSSAWGRSGISLFR